MFFDWLKRRRREAILAGPYDARWTQHLRDNVGLWRTLSDEERAHLIQLVRVFVAEKRWEGAGGLELSDEIRVTIAGNACVLVLALPHDLYQRVESIIVYPSVVHAPPPARSVFDVSTDLAEHPMPIYGQAFQRGPVILVWDATLHGARNPTDGHNVVFHEFAHKLDMLSGDADGVPPLHDRDQYARWVAVFQREWDALHERQERGRPTFLDAYAGTDPAEFFAVATEQFFEQGEAMSRRHPELYDVLRGFYRQDPAARATRRRG